METFIYVFQKLNQLVVVLRGHKTPWGMSWFGLLMGFMAVTLLFTLYRIVTNIVPSGGMSFKGTKSHYGDRIQKVDANKERSKRLKRLVNRSVGR
jgi:hypothetical protein